MPTYEFRCPDGHEFEKFYRKISDAPAIVNCPECGAVAERRMSAGAGLLFKGSGFYITDYGKDGKGPKKAESEGGGGAEPKGGEPKSGESKSDKGGESKSSSTGAAAGGSKKGEGGSGGSSGGGSSGGGGGSASRSTGTGKGGPGKGGGSAGGGT